MNARDRRGFTLPELIVVTVLGALVVLASLQILITNQRTYTAQNAQIQGQQNTRAALAVLTNEIREMSPAGSDLLTIEKTRMKVRVMRKFGLACEVDLNGDPELRVLKVGHWIEKDDSVFVFAENDDGTDKDDVWLPAEVKGIKDTTVACGGRPAADVELHDHNDLFEVDSVRIGAPVRSFEHLTYGLVEVNGQYYLGRESAGGLPPVPMVGPLKATDGLQFTYLDDNGAVTATPADVRQVAVTVRTHSGVLNSVGEMVSDSISAWIYTRN